MKKLISLVALYTLFLSCTSAPQEVVDTMELPPTTEYLTEQDLSTLYTCKEYEAPTDTDIVEISYSDAQLLMRISVCEDCTDAYSQAYVMSVILNRVESENFPNTIREVIYEDNQFSPVDDGRFDTAEPDVNSHLALAMIESGEVSTDYLYFEALSVEDSWQSKHRQVAKEYGGTRYYR